MGSELRTKNLEPRTKNKEIISDFKKKFDTFFAEFFDREIEEAEKLGREYQELLTIIKKYCLRGGKRLRPYLAYFAFSSIASSGQEEVIKATISLELIHQFILIHDDIIDRDQKRYGGKTLSIEFEDIASKRGFEESDHFGVSIATIAGDLLFNLAQKNLSATPFPDDIKTKLLYLSTDALNKTIAGWYEQYLDTNEKLGEQTEEDFYRIQELVTANYSFIFPFKFGLTLAGADEELIKQFTKLGRYLGIAYQIQDDILGTYGDEKASGKSAANDIREGKKTLLAIKAYKDLPLEARKQVSSVIGKKNATDLEIGQIRKYFKEVGAWDYSLGKIKEYSQKGESLLDELPIKEDIKKELYALTKMLSGRIS